MPPTPSDPNDQHDDGARIRPEYSLPHAIRLAGRAHRDADTSHAPATPPATSRPYAPGPSERRFTTLAGDPILQPPAPPVATRRFDTLAEVNAAFPCLDVRIAAAERQATMPAARSRAEGPPETLWPDLHEDRAIINAQPEGYDLTSGEPGQLDISTISVDQATDPLLRAQPAPKPLDWYLR